MTNEEKLKAVRLEDWSLKSDPYAAPEVRTQHLHGLCPNHPRGRSHPDKPILTSRIVEVDGRYVRTRSGTIYHLGSIAAQFREYLREIGRDYDSTRPLAPLDGVAEDIGPALHAPPKDQLDECIVFKNTPGVADGWGCCRCRTYNNNARTSCKRCSHVHCGLEHLNN